MKLSCRVAAYTFVALVVFGGCDSASVESPVVEPPVVEPPVMEPPAPQARRPFLIGVYEEERVNQGSGGSNGGWFGRSGTCILSADFAFLPGSRFEFRSFVSQCQSGASVDTFVVAGAFDGTLDRNGALVHLRADAGFEFLGAVGMSDGRVLSVHLGGLTITPGLPVSTALQFKYRVSGLRFVTSERIDPLLTTLPPGDVWTVNGTLLKYYRPNHGGFIPVDPPPEVYEDLPTQLSGSSTGYLDIFDMSINVNEEIYVTLGNYRVRPYGSNPPYMFSTGMTGRVIRRGSIVLFNPGTEDEGFGLITPDELRVFHMGNNITDWGSRVLYGTFSLAGGA